ncbi:MAG: SDR family oxidoreductase [Verrucomicrobiales bacterium]|nr:SDR family oxidoreductase [Verrucomicrobiales bacterium]
MNPAPRVVITGGEGDLAQAIAAVFRTDGWEVLAPGRDALDVTQTNSVRDFFAPLERLDLLIHQAGSLRDVPMLRMETADFADVLDVHLTGAFRCAQAALKKMTRQRIGHIIHIGSYSALIGPAGQANYAAAKAGLIGLTQSLAAEYGARNVRVNCVLPGFLDTKMTRHLLDDPVRKAEILATHTLGRLNTPSEVAHFISQLHRMQNVSGQIFQLDSRIHRWT